MKWFNDIKIRSKLLIVFGILLAITIFFVSFAIMGLRTVGENLNELINSYQARQILIADSITDVYKIHLINMSKGYLLDDELNNLVSHLSANHESNIQSAKYNLSHFRELVVSDTRLTAEEKQTRLDKVSEIDGLFDEYLKITDDLGVYAQDHNRPEVVVAIESAIPLGSLLSDKMQELLDLVYTTNQRQTEYTQNVSTNTLIIFICISIALMTIAVLVLIFTIRNINRPIAGLEHAVGEIAEGNLAFPIRTDRKDELGSLANCIGNMVDELVDFNKVSTIMDNLDSMICVTDLDYNLLFANKSMAKAFGFDHENCIGEKCYRVTRGFEAPCPGCLIPELLPEKDSLPSVSYTHKWDEHLSTWVSGAESIIHWSDGSLVFFSYINDSSELKEQEELLQNALLSAKTASAAKSSFLARMSHEIRTPMNVILGISEMQLQNDELDPDLREAMAMIYSSGDLLLGIINDILDLSKIEAGKLELAPSVYEVASLINDTVSLNLMRIGSKPIEFELLVDKNTRSTLIGDELRIKQIINNLLSNAFKYTQEGMVRLSVSTEPSSEEDTEVMLVFTVSDTGQGMTGEQIDKLYDEYARFNTNANRATEGTGLGMSITHNLIDMMNGSISVKSEINLGSIFTVSLPQGKTDTTVLGVELAESLQSFKLSDAKQIRKTQIVYEPMPYGRVLLVDDAESNFYVAGGLLAPYKLKIDTATSGFEAIHMIEDGYKYDIVFMDHMMPKMDGVETTQKLRDAGYETPIVALTANAVAGQAEMFLENGFDAFISKPIDMRQLNSVLKQFVRDRQPPEVIEAAHRSAVVERDGASSRTAGKKPIDPQLVEIFIKEATQAYATLDALYGKAGEYTDEDIKTYVINVHAMKSALANVGERQLSIAAAELERVARNNLIPQRMNETPAFLKDLKATIEKLVELTPSAEDDAEIDEDYDYLSETLKSVKEACDKYDKKTAKTAITDLRARKWALPIREQLEAMSENLLRGDFEEVSQTAEDIVSGL